MTVIMLIEMVNHKPINHIPYQSSFAQFNFLTWNEMIYEPVHDKINNLGYDQV